MKKTQCITFNLHDHTNDSVLPVDKSRPLHPKPYFMSGLSIYLNGIDIEKVSDFKYLGAYIRYTASDIRIRKALAWKALNSMNTCWKSSLPGKLKLDSLKPPLGQFYYMAVKPGLCQLLLIVLLTALTPAFLDVFLGSAGNLTHPIVTFMVIFPNYQTSYVNGDSDLLVTFTDMNNK